MMLDLPPKFVQTIQDTFGVDGKRWLESFPVLLEEASRRWGLTDIQPVSNLSYNFVALATKLPSPLTHLPAGDENIILKIGVPNRELTSEIAALRLYNGHGTCRLLDADADKGMLLLERLLPGRMLSTVEDDERATHIAADVMLNLWKSSSDFSRYKTTTPAPAGGGGEVVTTDFIQLKDWFEGFKRLRQRFNGGTGPLSRHLVEAAESLSQELLAENKDEVLLHGDFHHFNVLEFEARLAGD